MRSTDLADLYRDYIDCLNRRDWASLGRFVADEIEYNGQPIGFDRYRELLQGNVRDIPDLRFDIDLIVCDPPQLAARLAFNCTPTGLFMNLPIDGRRVSFNEHVFYIFRDFRIASVWSVLDKAAIEAQIG